jgi:hypothetical protein
MQTELKLTASLKSTLKEGGKLEDARKLLRMAKLEKWKIPKRDLRTGAITGFTDLITDDSWSEKGVLNLASTLFWLSLQISTNFLCIHKWMDEQWYYPMYVGSKEWYEKDLNHAKLIGIDEPGKLRMLIKTNSLLNWAIGPGSKLIQKGLATHKDHRAGLEMGAQDWNLNKRISGESNESNFLYDRAGFLKPTSHAGQTDWSSASDLLSKMKGFQMVKTYMLFTGFPEYYGRIILNLTKLPLQVLETNYLSNGELEFKDENMYTFKEGFMMGLQLTKAYLHLTHVYCEGLAAMHLEKHGFVFDNVRKDLRERTNGLLYSTEKKRKVRLLK